MDRKLEAAVIWTVILLTVVSVAVVGAATVQVAAQEGEQQPQGTVDQPDVETALGGGTAVVNASVVETKEGGADLELIVESSSGGTLETPQMRSAMLHGGQLQTSRYQLAQGRTEVPAQGFEFEGAYVAQVRYQGQVSFLRVDKPGHDRPEGNDYVGAGSAFFAVIFIGRVLAWIQNQHLEDDVEEVSLVD